MARMIADKTAPMQVIEQKIPPRFLAGIVTADVRTFGNATAVFSVVFPRLACAVIPASFVAGLADCDAGRTVDMEQALHQTPCGCAA